MDGTNVSIGVYGVVPVFRVQWHWYDSKVHHLSCS